MRVTPNPDTLTPETNLGRAMINVCTNAWVGKIRGLSDEDTHSLIMAGLKKIFPNYGRL